MEPIITAAIIAGGMQMVNSYFANQGASEKADQIEAALANIDNPQYDFSQLSPEQYAVVAKYIPQLAKVLEEKAPQVVQRSGVGKEALGARMSALQKLRQASEQKDLESQLAMEEANNNARQQNSILQATNAQSMARRGIAPGSGLEFAQMLSGQAQSAQDAAAGGRMAALEGRKRALGALRDSADIASSVDRDELNLATGNADIINQFNARTANRQQQVMNMNTEAVNDGNRFNTQTQQRVADANVADRNKFKVDERNNQNALKQQTYNDQMGKVKVQAGIADTQASNIRGAAQDTNSAIQGGANMIGSYYMNEDKKAENAKWGKKQ